MDIEEIKRRVELRQGDITEMEVDAIVNSSCVRATSPRWRLTR